MKTRTLFLVLLTVGCGTNGSVLADRLVPVTRDAGLLAPDSGSTIDAGVDGPPRDIEIVAFLHSQAKQDGGRSYPFLVPRLADVRAQWQWRDGGWGTSQGRLLEDGGYLIPNVPAGEAIVIFPNTQGLVSSASFFDFSWTVQGRPTAEFPNPNVPTTVRISADGLPPWAPGDALVFSSLETPFRLLQLSMITVGSTAISGALRWDQERVPMFRGSEGDSFMLSTMRPRLLGQVSYQSMTAGRTISPPDLTVGANINVTLSLVEPTPAGADVHIDFPGFEQALREARPGQALLASSFEVTHRRGLREVGVVRYGYRGNEAGLPMALGERIPIGLPDTRGRVQWADLMPRDELVASISTRFDVRVSAGSVIDSIPVFVTRTLPVSDTIELVPTLTVPRALAVNGAPSTSFRAGVGLTPTLSWDAPARGSPSRYLIVILDLVDQNFSQAFYTTKRTFTVPPFTLTAERTYVAVISAQAGMFDPLNPLFQPASFESIGTVTEAFSP